MKLFISLYEIIWRKSFLTNKSRYINKVPSLVCVHCSVANVLLWVFMFLTTWNRLFSLCVRQLIEWNYHNYVWDLTGQKPVSCFFFTYTLKVYTDRRKKRGQGNRCQTLNVWRKFWENPEKVLRKSWESFNSKIFFL